ncbi:MAG TPA: hypothetical protein VFL57_05745 [Bryobacteraceae bacterium]|nr:hypothetical protein [Bryobacteraceae bacterium]
MHRVRRAMLVTEPGLLPSPCAIRVGARARERPRRNPLLACASSKIRRAAALPPWPDL